MSASPPLFPMFVDLHGRSVLVVGGGVVARRKTGALLAAGARVTIGAPALEKTLSGWLHEGKLAHRQGDFANEWLDDVWLVIAATDDAEVNRRVAKAAQQRRLWVNVVDDAELSTFQVPARIERGPLQIAISSGGGAPMLARALRERLETQLDESWGALAELLSRQREQIRQRLPEMGPRRRFFDTLLSGPLSSLLRRGDSAGAQKAFDRSLARAASDDTAKSRGSVALVGAGPGDPGLLTLRGLRVLNEADVILHDRLVSADVLSLARRDAELIEVGKQAGNHHVTQPAIHALMLEHARRGQRVVRLKGGDPFVFGRGGEELEFLRTHDIDYEVVPGITAAVACAAYAGIPLTHRDHAQSLRVITAHFRDAGTGRDALDWRSLARDRQTLAIYMGVSELATLRERLVAHGADPATPFAMIENGSRPDQRVILGQLADLPETAQQHRVQSPTLLILGDVASLAEPLHWFGQPPLRGSATVDPLQRAA